MKRISLDIPLESREAGLLRQADEQPLRGPIARLKLDPPIVPSRGRRFDLSNEQIYELIEP